MPDAYGVYFVAISEDLGWFWKIEEGKDYDAQWFAQRTRPVGQKLANDWGLYDMYGNVVEWC